MPILVFVAKTVIVFSPHQAKPIYGGWLLLAPEGTNFDNPLHRSRVSGSFRGFETDYIQKEAKFRLFTSL